MNDQKVAESLMTFARYLSWADLLRAEHDVALRKPNQSGAADPVWGSEFAWMSYWYSSLFVVIEAYESIGMTDPVIDALLAHPGDYRGLLKRYRNGIFHYQADLIDSRLLNLLDRGEEHVLWVYSLHEEFNRLLRAWITSYAISEHLRAETESVLKRLVGWLPDDAEIREFDHTVERLRGLVERDPPPGLEPQHSEIRENLIEAHALRRNCVEQRDRLRRERLRRLGITLLDHVGN